MGLLGLEERRGSCATQRESSPSQRDSASLAWPGWVRQDGRGRPQSALSQLSYQCYTTLYDDIYMCDIYSIYRNNFIL